MAEKVSPPPLQSPALVNGFFTEAWVKFFTRLYRRAGGEEALTNLELGDQQISDFDDVTAAVDALGSTVATHTSQIASLTSLVQGLQVEPVA